MTSDIITQLEAAPEGSRELNEVLAKMVGTFRSERSKDEISGVHFGPDYSPPYTTSLDAKLPWENIVRVAIFEMKGKIKCDATHWDEATKTATLGTGHTEPLARRCAALKAWEQKP